MRNGYSSFFWITVYLSICTFPNYAQGVFSRGHVEFIDGSTKTGEVAYRQRRSGSKILFRTDRQATYNSFDPKDVHHFQIDSNRYVSHRLSADTNSAIVFMRQLVSGEVNLLLYERADGRDVFLLEQHDTLVPINAKYPLTTLSQLPECSGMKLTLLNKASSVSSNKLTRYIAVYNRCIKPDSPTQVYNTSPRFWKISVGARVFLPMGYYRIKFDNGVLYPPSTRSSKPSFGLSINLSSRGRLGAGLDLGLLNRKGRWINDSSAIVVKLAEQSLYINPYLRYEFRRHSRQVLTPYLTAGVIFNKILNGQVIINPLYDYMGSLQPLAINQEAGLDELGGSLGGGVQWQLTPKLAFVADARLLYTVSALSVFETPPLNNSTGGQGARFTPRSYLLNCSVGVNVNL